MLNGDALVRLASCMWLITIGSLIATRPTFQERIQVVAWCFFLFVWAMIAYEMNIQSPGMYVVLFLLIWTRAMDWAPVPERGTPQI